MKKIALLLVVVMLFGMFAACGSSETAAEGTKEETADESTTESAGEAAAEGSTRDTVTCATNMVITTIHPFDMTSLQCNQIRSQIYESFYYFNDATKEFEPRLAETYSTNEDGTVYTFNLRQGVKFHNGEEMKASDVVYSINCALEHPSLTSYVAAIDSAEVVDDYTVNINLKSPSAPFMSNLTNVYIVSEKACTEAGDSLGSTIVDCGTGPYKITEYNPDVQIVMTATEDYYRGEAAIKTAIFKPIVDASTGLVAFENGEIDFYNIPTSDWEAISTSGKYNTELVAANHISYFNINYTGVLADKNLRLAIAHCIDKDAMNMAAYDGLAIIADCMVNSAYVVGAPEDPIVYEYDLEKAKEYLAAAGYADGVDIGKILTPAGGYYEKMALVLQSSLADIGITCTLDSMEQAAAIAQMGTGDFDILICGYTGQFDYDFWKIMTHTMSDDAMFVKMARADESLGLKADEIDALYEQAEVEMDPEVRNDLYKQVDDLIMETACWMPVFYKGIPYAWNIDLNASNHSTYYQVYEWSWNS